VTPTGRSSIAIREALFLIPPQGNIQLPGLVGKFACY